MTLDFSRPEDQKAKELAQEFGKKEIGPIAARYHKTDEFPSEVVRKAPELGLSDPDRLVLGGLG